MNNNDIIRRIRYTFDFNDTKMIEIFALADGEVFRPQLSNWLKKDDDEEFIEIDDYHLAIYLNGLIINLRGKKEGAKPVAEKILNNNIILRKLKIALNLQDDAILKMLESTGLKISKHELSAFFRNPKQRQYRECKNQILRNFLKGMQMKYRSSS